MRFCLAPQNRQHRGNGMFRVDRLLKRDSKLRSFAWNDESNRAIGWLRRFPFHLNLQTGQLQRSEF